MHTPLLHQFENTSACLGNDGAFTMILPGQSNASYHQVEIYSRDDQTTPKVVHPAPLTVHLAGNCSSMPTLHMELPLVVEGPLHLNGQDLDTRLSSLEQTTGPFSYVSRATGSLTDNEGFPHLPFPDLTKTFTLEATSQVLVYYAVSWQSNNYGTGWSFMNTALWDDGNNAEMSSGRSMQGIDGYTSHVTHTNNGFWAGTLAAGTYTYSVRYRSKNVAVIGDANQFERYMYVVIV
eukprot:5955797-Prymnesium_polylepis.1